MGLFTRRPRSLRANFTVIAVMMMAVGGGLAFMSLRSINYQQTDGHIIESAIVRSGKGTKTRIRYGYTVNQVNYENDTVTYGLTMLRGKQGLIRQYPAGRRVPVYYSITDPSYSVLEKGFSFGSLGMSFLGATLFVVLRLFRA